LLRERGYTVITEQATQIIKEGELLPWVDRDAFQKEVLRRQLEVEAPHVNSNVPIFLDRGLFDGEAYYISDGLEIPPSFRTMPASRYTMALVIEELPFFDNNGVRFEDLEFTRKITPIIERCYTSRNVPVARVPALPPHERVDFVLEIVQSCMTTQSVLPHPVLAAL
jgi:predicted ATPase